MARASFGTAVSCIDGRVHLPVINWMRGVLALDFVDLVTYPGADGFVAHEPERAAGVLRPSIEISIARHGSPVLALVGHYECAASPGTASQHREHLLEGLRVLQQWSLGVKLIALWVGPAMSSAGESASAGSGELGSEWQVEVLRTRAADARTD